MMCAMFWVQKVERGKKLMGRDGYVCFLGGWNMIECLLL